MKKLSFTFLVLILLLVITACAQEQSEEQKTEASTVENNTNILGDYEELSITFSHNQPIGSPEDVGAEAFKSYVEEKSGGKITVDIFPASQLGSLREQVESTQIGEINITMQPASVITPFVDDIKIVDLPYLLPTETEKMYQVLDGEVGQEILGTLEQGGFKGLGYWPGGYKLISTKDAEIHSPSDLEGLKIRVMESPLLISQYEAWGASAIPMAYAEVYNGLQQGIVDGQENPLQTIYLNNYHEVQGFVMDTKHGAMTYILMANQSWFEGLSEDTQKLILEAEEHGRTEARNNLVATEEEYRQNIIDSGTVYYELTDEEIAVFKNVSEATYSELYGAGNQPELLEKFKQVINELN
ncbi:TRAP transporter substrate-binding protein [Lysinibacillus telephonicus]|uniref:TRAP transporter substrate-binding protein n=1 Tax=Lysinibacillus telephonicus TaxID=1714840 RepID=UPI0031FBEDD1